jgi:hypothetical protein
MNLVEGLHRSIWRMRRSVRTCYHVLRWLQMVFRLVSPSVDHLHTDLELQAIIAPLTDLHHSQIATPVAKPFPVRSVFTSRCLAKASSSGNRSASHSQGGPRRSTLFPRVTIFLNAHFSRGNVFTEPLLRNGRSYRVSPSEWVYIQQYEPTREIINEFL